MGRFLLIILAVVLGLLLCIGGCFVGVTLMSDDKPVGLNSDDYLYSDEYDDDEYEDDDEYYDDDDEYYDDDDASGNNGQLDGNKPNRPNGPNRPSRPDRDGDGRQNNGGISPVSPNNNPNSNPNNNHAANNGNSYGGDGPSVPSNGPSVPNGGPSVPEGGPSSYENNGQIIELNDKNFAKLCMGLDGNNYVCPVPCVVDCGAEWCGWCKKLEPIMAKVQKKYGNRLQIFRVDVDKSPKIQKLFEAQSLPTLIFVDASGNGVKAEGYMEESELIETIQKYCKPASR